MLTRRALTLVIVGAPVVWAVVQAVPDDGDILNRGGLRLLGDLLGTALRPALSPEYLAQVASAAAVTAVFAVLGTAGALLIGAIGGLVLSDAVWDGRPARTVRVLRLVLRAALVAARSVHEVVWALLLVSVFGLDPLVAVLAIAIPFGAQTAKVFADTLDAVPAGPFVGLRLTGATRGAAIGYALLPIASPLLISYSCYRLECAIRSAVVLGVVGVGGLGQELVVSLSSRNWGEVWTVVGAVVLLSAIVETWSGRLRAGSAVAGCSDWSSGRRLRAAVGRPAARGSAPQAAAGRQGRQRWSAARWSATLAIPVLIACWYASDASWAGVTSPRTRELAGRLLADLWPPASPRGGWVALGGAVLDTVAMAVLAMLVAVVVTVALAPWAARRALDPSSVSGQHWSRWAGGTAAVVRIAAWLMARGALLVLRSVPPTVWAVIALFVLFPGILPGAIALGLYTGGILGRLVAEGWESVDARPRATLVAAGVPAWLAGLMATVPPSVGQLLTYTVYRFEICIRDTAVVGVVGAAGLGRLLAESLAAFRFEAVSSVLAASFAVSVVVELAGRRIRRALGAQDRSAG